MAQKRISDFENSLLSREEKYLIYNEYYKSPHKSESDDFFDQNEPINDYERKNYFLYWKMLLVRETSKRQKFECETEEIERQESIKKKLKDLEKQKEIEYQNRMKKLINLLDNRFKIDSSEDFLKLNDLFNKISSCKVYEILDGEPINNEFRDELIQDVQAIFNRRVDAEFVLDKLKLKGRQLKVNNQVLNSRGRAYAPSSFTGNLNLIAAQDEKNIIFGYPLDIQLALPVVFFHEMFGDFLDIINDNSDNIIFKKYYSFLDSQNNIKNIDDCCLELFKIILNSTGTEKDISKGVTKAFKDLFGTEFIEENFPIQKFLMDVMISLNNFPFAIIELNDRKYSIDVVYQALQYYASFTERYLDNFPAFILTIDRGFMFIYGAVTVNRKTICDHLVSIELSGCRSEINNSAKMFRRAIGALLFFHQKLKSRLKNVSNDVHRFVDEIDEKFNDLNSLMIANSVHELVFFPSIFFVKSYEDSSKLIPIKFVKKVHKNVFIVTLDLESENRKCVLKLSNNYGIDAHLHLAKLDLAPKIIGYENIYGNYHVILMECMDEISWKMLIEYQSEINNKTFNTEIIFKSLKDILDNFNSAGFVHGDFRNCNILMKVSGDTKFEFKIIDFDCSGKIDSRYSNLIFKNPKISWPRNDFGSDSKRKKEHDLFMFETMKNEMIAPINL